MIDSNSYALDVAVVGCSSSFRTSVLDLHPAHLPTALAITLIGAGASSVSVVVFSGAVRDGFVFLFLAPVSIFAAFLWAPPRMRQGRAPFEDASLVWMVTRRYSYIHSSNDV